MYSKKGNGPSAITLSYFLSGHWPYYCGNDELRHPIEFLDERLRSRPNIPMILQDLKQLSEVSHGNVAELGRNNGVGKKKRRLKHSELIALLFFGVVLQGLEGRSSNPVSLLFDALNHPGADLGLDMPTFLTWKYHPEHAIDHVVLGSGLPGGSWQVRILISYYYDTAAYAVRSFLARLPLFFTHPQLKRGACFALLTGDGRQRANNQSRFVDGVARSALPCMAGVAC